MKLLYTFEGIKLERGQYPRAIVLASFPLTEVPDELANFKVTISVPISDPEQSLAETAAQAIGLAQRLLNAQEAAKWVQSQKGGTLVELSSEPGAADALGAFPPPPPDA